MPFFLTVQWKNTFSIRIFRSVYKQISQFLFFLFDLKVFWTIYIKLLFTYKWNVNNIFCFVVVVRVQTILFAFYVFGYRSIYFYARVCDELYLIFNLTYEITKWFMQLNDVT